MFYVGWVGMISCLAFVGGCGVDFGWVWVIAVAGVYCWFSFAVFGCYDCYVVLLLLCRLLF